MVEIAIVNTSGLITAAQVAAGIAAINAQIAEDFAPRWGVSGTLTAVAVPPAGAYVFQLQDGIDIADDLGYHTYAGGGVSAKIDVRGALNVGMDPMTALSHEALEALADPLTTRFAPDGSTLVEVCDPVSQSWYEKSGVMVANFVLPNYFGFNASAGPYDFLGKLATPAPGALPGGYCEQYIGGQYVMHAMRLPNGALSYMAVRPHGRRRWRASR